MRTLTDDARNRLDGRLAEAMAGAHVPGAAAGAVLDGQLVWEAGVGHADRKRDTAPDSRTLYRIASITKTFTGAAVLQLRDAGRLRLDDPLVAHLPEMRAARNRFGPIDDVSLRGVLTHHAGLQGEAPGSDERALRFPTTPEVLAAAGEIEVTIPPWSAYKYSNLGFQLLGEVVARASGMPYTEYIAQRLLAPLGMAASGFDPPAAARARGYDHHGYSDALRPAAELPPDGIEADGGLWSCVADLARWAAFWTGDDHPEVLAPQTRAEALTPRLLVGEAWREGQGLAWHAARRDALVVTGHEGGLHGFSSSLRMSAPHGAAAVVLVNGVADVSDLAGELCERVALAAPPAAPTVTAPAPPPRADAEPLLGLYVEDRFGSCWRIEHRDGGLVLDDQGGRWRLTPAAEPRTFVVGGGRRAGETLRLAPATGPVERLRLAGMELVRLGERG